MTKVVNGICKKQHPYNFYNSTVHDITFMERIPVESSNIQAIGYDPVTGVMEVEFGRDVYPGYPYNRVYQYFDVPVEVHQALMDAGSHGKYLYEFVAREFTYKYLGTLKELGE